MSNPHFKDEYDFHDRKQESSRVLKKYPERVPVICEKRRGSHLEHIDKKKYLVPGDLTAGQFIYVIRKRLSLPAEKAIFLFVEGTIPTISASLAELYYHHKDSDGFLYIIYSEENVFG